MTFLLAQMPTVSTTEIGVWFACATCAVIMANQVKKLFVKEPPDHARYADRAETNKRLDQLDLQIREVQAEHRGQYEALIKAGEDRAVMLRTEFRQSVGNSHKRIDGLLEKLGEVVGELKRIGEKRS